jgi:hypothetical protein
LSARSSHTSNSFLLILNQPPTAEWFSEKTTADMHLLKGTQARRNKANTCAIEVKHSSKGNKSLSESGNCCHFVINGGIKISRYFACRCLKYHWVSSLYYTRAVNIIAVSLQSWVVDT